MNIIQPNACPQGMKPLRVTIKLRSPLGENSLPRLLDGLLAWCATEDFLGNMMDDDCDMDESMHVSELSENLPLASIQSAHGPVWMSSVWMPVGRVKELESGNISLDKNSYAGYHDQRMFTRKSDVFEIARLIGNGFIRVRGYDVKNPKPYEQQVNTGSGLFKGYKLSYALRSVTAIEAWCIGDQDHIQALLDSHVEFIGAKRRLGHGAVSEISVVEDDRAQTLWRLRPLPSDIRSDFDIPVLADQVEIDSPLRAPYWAREDAIRQLAPASIFW